MKLGTRIILSSPIWYFLQAKKGKKAVKKATLSGASAKAGRKEDLDAFGGGNYDYGDEFDDFMWKWQQMNMQDSVNTTSPIHPQNLNKKLFEFTLVGTSIA